jgi:LuxR family maltose regulon positive regulatory protein
VRRQLAEFRSDDLRFTPTEAAAFLNQAMGLALLPRHISALESRTEGWIAGLQLAAVSLQGRRDVDEFINNFTGSNFYVLDYLAQEVFNQQPADVRQFLLDTAVLNRLTGPLCDALTGRQDGQSMLERLAHSNVFVTPLDEEHRWFRYHRLFADLLQHRLRQSGGNIPAKHQRAALWYEQEKYFDKAIDHALLAQDYGLVERLLLENIERTVSQGKMTLILGWLDALPPDWLAVRPSLEVVYAWMQYLHGRNNPSLERLQRVQRNLADPALAGKLIFFDDGAGSEIQTRALISALSGQFAIYQGDMPRAIALMEESLAGLPPDDVTVRAYIFQSLALAYWANGDSANADRIQAEVNALKKSGDLLTTLVITSQMAEHQWLRGNYQQSAVLLGRVFELLQHRPIPFIADLAHVEMSYLLYEWNNLPAAKEYLMQVIDEIDPSLPSKSVRTLVIGFVGLVLLKQAEGDEDAVDKILAGAELQAQIINLEVMNAIIDYVKVFVWARRGNTRALAYWVRQNQQHIREYSGGITLWPDGLVRAYLGLGQLAEAEAFGLRLLQQEQRPLGGLGESIRLRIMLALVYRAKGQPEEALTHLRSALTIAEPEGYIRSFVDEGSEMAALLRQVIEGDWPDSPDQPSREYVQQLLAAFSQPADAPALPPPPEMPALVSPPPTPPVSSPLVEPLTQREVEILHLLASGLSNKEIAEELVITPGTVKVHTSHIYGKLEVKSRTQAIAKAQNLGVLPHPE